jgi:hypothetical protein
MRISPSAARNLDMALLTDYRGAPVLLAATTLLMSFTKISLAAGNADSLER